MKRGEGGTEEARTFSGGSLPKTGPLPGSLQPEWKRCGKAGCRCARCELHGP